MRHRPGDTGRADGEEASRVGRATARAAHGGRARHPRLPCRPPQTQRCGEGGRRDGGTGGKKATPHMEGTENGTAGGDWKVRRPRRCARQSQYGVTSTCTGPPPDHAHSRPTTRGSASRLSHSSIQIRPPTATIPSSKKNREAVACPGRHAGVARLTSDGCIPFRRRFKGQLATRQREGLAAGDTHLPDDC